MMMAAAAAAMNATSAQSCLRAGDIQLEMLHQGCNAVCIKLSLCHEVQQQHDSHSAYLKPNQQLLYG
jgi:hypothetical protein